MEDLRGSSAWHGVDRRSPGVECSSLTRGSKRRRCSRRGFSPGSFDRSLSPGQPGPQDHAARAVPRLLTSQLVTWATGHAFASACGLLWRFSCEITGPWGRELTARSGVAVREKGRPLRRSAAASCSACTRRRRRGQTVHWAGLRTSPPRRPRGGGVDRVESTEGPRCNSQPPHRGPGRPGAGLGRDDHASGRSRDESPVTLSLRPRLLCA